MKAKLVTTIALGTAGVGLWQMQRMADRDHHAEQQRLENPQSLHDCLRTELLLKGMGGANTQTQIDGKCQRRLEEKGISIQRNHL